MKKDHTRDYVTEAFRLYAKLGMPTYEDLRERIYNKAIFRYRGLNPADAVIQAENIVRDNEPLLLDIMAVNKTIELLNEGGEKDIVNAVKSVYFVYSHMELRRDDITARVHRFSIEYPASERVVYKWLKMARVLCAATRGLRINGLDM